MKFEAIAAGAKPRLAGYKRLETEGAYVTGYKEAEGRLVPRVSTSLSARDRLGALAVRWDVGRGNYKVLPGLYAVGDPGRESPVLVSANYKLSFDSLRRELGGIDAWILVLDTKGVNVWCAAGKGTFGTAELLDKLARTRLADMVSRNVLVLPQLGAPGVSAPEIARLSRFRVAWGPVRASDLPAFLASGMRKTPEMGRVRFGLADRLAVAPVDLVQAGPYLLAAIGLSALAALPASPGYWARLAWLLAAAAGSILVGTIAFPALLPCLPSRAFSIKGAFLGALWGGACAAGATSAGARGGGMGAGLGAALVLIGAAAVSYLGLNFTGSTTFTSQKGAELEVRRALVPTAASLGLGLCLGAASRILGF